MNMGEREMPSVPGTIEGIDAQHIQRYEFARSVMRGRSVCDAACGCGYGSVILRAEHYLGIDRDIETVAFAEAHYASANTSFLTHDLHCLPLMRRFDVCVSFETIEHLENPDAFLDWSAQHCESLIASSPIADRVLHSPFHIREYSVDDFRTLLESRWKHVTLFVQDKDIIRYPCVGSDTGNVIAVCW